MPRSEHASGHSFGTRAELRLVDGADLPSQVADVSDGTGARRRHRGARRAAGDTARGRQRELRASLRRPGGAVSALSAPCWIRTLGRGCPC